MLSTACPVNIVCQYTVPCFTYPATRCSSHHLPLKPHSLHLRLHSLLLLPRRFHPHSGRRRRRWSPRKSCRSRRSCWRRNWGWGCCCWPTCSGSGWCWRGCWPCSSSCWCWSCLEGGRGTSQARCHVTSALPHHSQWGRTLWEPYWLIGIHQSYLYPCLLTLKLHKYIYNGSL